MDTYTYQGHELDLFQHAVNWKRYYALTLRNSVRGDVLEVGAGIGATSRYLCSGRETSWTCLEPDPTLAAQLQSGLAVDPLPTPTRTVVGSLDALDAQEKFDTLLYIDVLEHISDDRAELERAAGRLRPGGRLIVLSPAHNWLFSPFDRAIGHFRRYSKRTLTNAAPQRLSLVRAFYLDSAGMLASIANRAILRADYPGLAQVRFWDSVLVPVSQVLDPMFGRRLGKTIVAIWMNGADSTSVSQRGLGASH
jgi:SAM-dependent methyltransferase